MNKRFYIKQDGTIPGHRIIEELERRGGKNSYNVVGLGKNAYYYFGENPNIDAYGCQPIGYTELLYNKETDSFYENSPVLSNSPKDGKVIIKKKRWQPKEGDTVWHVCYLYEYCPISNSWDRDYQLGINDFQTKEECQAFCNKLNAAIKSVLEERRKEVEK